MRPDYLVLRSLVKVFGTGENTFTAVDSSWDHPVVEKQQPLE
jgi:hypothetical protein